LGGLFEGSLVASAHRVSDDAARVNWCQPEPITGSHQVAHVTTRKPNPRVRQASPSKQTSQNSPLPVNLARVATYVGVVGVGVGVM
jgi:hypothetical protein